MDNLQLIRPTELCKLLSISIATLYRWEKNGKLPINKIKIGPGAVGYKISEVEKWLEDQTMSASSSQA